MGWFYALIGAYCAALLVAAIDLYKRRGFNGFMVFAVVYVAAIIAIVVSGMDVAK